MNRLADEEQASKDAAMLDDARFWSKVIKTPTCWLWTDYLTDGYGRFWSGGRRVMAHRWSYERFVGPIPAGLFLDHVKKWGCTSRACVNPAHLEPVTNQENLRRAMSDDCPRGHRFTAENTHLDRHGYRVCRACHREDSTERNRRTFVCELCGETRNRSHRNRHMRAMHSEVAARDGDELLRDVAWDAISGSSINPMEKR